MNTCAVAISTDTILSDLERSVTTGDLDLLVKQFNQLKNINNEVCCQIPNVIIPACKFNNETIIKYLLGKDAVDIIIRFNKEFFKPDDVDSCCCNAFYYSIRSSNVNLLNFLISSWPENYFISNLSHLDNLLSSAYQLLIINKVSLTNNMKFNVESHLSRLRYSLATTEEDINNYDCIEHFISELIENINDILQVHQTNEKYLYIMTNISRNIFILKRILKCTYDRIPWEEMEFCSVCFISANEKIEEFNFYSGLVLNRKRIENHLSNFLNSLRELKGHLRNIDIKKIGLLPKINCEEARRNIVKDFEPLQHLYDDFQLVRDLYSLERIRETIDLVRLIDPLTKRGQETIFRALQVIGENLKNTLEAPKLSKVTIDLLLLYLPHNTKKIIVEIRNSLSHAHSLYKRKELEKETDSFVGIRNDIEKMAAFINDILLEKKSQVYTRILKTILDIQSTAELLEILDNQSWNYISFYQSITKIVNYMVENRRILDLLEDLDKSIGDKTALDNELISQMKKAVKDEEMKHSYRNYINLESTSVLNKFSDTFYRDIDSNTLKEIKSATSKALLRLNKLEFDYTYHQRSLKIPLEMREPVRSVMNFGKHMLKVILPRFIDDKKAYYHLQTLFLKITSFYFDICKIEEFDQLWDKICKRPKVKKSSTSTTGKLTVLLDSNVILSELEKLLISQKINIKTKQFFIEHSDSQQREVFKLAMESLLLDLMSSLEANNCLMNNGISVAKNPFILWGKCLRNHLAHDNLLFSVLINLDIECVQVINAIEYLEKRSKISQACDSLSLKDNDFKTYSNYHRDLKMISNKSDLFSAVEEGNVESVEKLVDKGADVFARDYRFNTSLHYAAKSSNIDIMTYLIQQNVKVGNKNFYGQSPLHVASKHGRLDAIKLLFQFDINANETDLSGMSPLHLASAYGHTGIAKLLLENGVEIRIKDLQGNEALHYAVIKNHIEIVVTLLEKGNHVDDSITIEGNTCLHDASKFGHSDLVKLLIFYKANIERRNRFGRTPLHIACEFNQCKVVSLLIEHGADINSNTVEGFTPLIIASNSGNFQIVNILIEKGALINDADFISNRTPLYFAAESGYDKIVKLLLDKRANINISSKNEHFNINAFNIAAVYNHINVLNTFLQHQKLDFNVNDSSNDLTALHFATLKGSLESVDILIKSGASLNVRDSVNGRTPLHFASMEGRTEIIDALLKNGAETDERDLEGFTPLHLAVKFGHKSAVEMLLDKNANVNILTKFSVGPLHIAAALGFEELVILLLKYSADVNMRDQSSTFTALHFACLGSSSAIFNLLIENGGKVDINCQSSLLLYAIQSGSKSILELLLNNYGISMQSRDIIPALLHSVKYNRKDFLELLFRFVNKSSDFVVSAQTLTNFFLEVAVSLGSVTITKALIKLKADVNASLLKEEKKKIIEHLRYVTDPETFAIVHSESKYNDERPLHIACLEGSKALADLLIQNGALINHTILLDGSTPLHLAILSNKGEIIDSLLKAGADIYVKNIYGMDPLGIAISEGNLEAVKKILFHVNKTNNNEWVSVQRNVNMSKAINDVGSSAVHIAAKNGHKNIIEYFVSLGMGVEEPDADNRTLLHYAAMAGNTDVIEFLLQSRCNINARDRKGCTPLHVASFSGNLNTVEHLLKFGCMYNAVSKDIGKPVDVAKYEIKQILGSTERLFKSVKQNNPSGVLSSISEGAFVNAVDCECASAIHYAAWKGYNKIIDILLSNKCDVNKAGKNGFSSLHFAVKFSHYDAAIALMKGGAIYDVLSYTHKIPLDIAEDKKIISLLSMVDSIFCKLYKNDDKVIDQLNKIKDADFMKTLFYLRNRKNQNLLVTAIKSKFGKIKELELIRRRYISLEIDGIADKIHNLEVDGKLNEALDLCKSVLESVERKFGANDPEVIKIEMVMAVILQNKQALHPALQLFTNVFNKAVDLYGHDDMLSLDVRKSMAEILLSLEKKDEAFAILRDVLDNLKLCQNVNLSLLKNTADISRVLGKYEEALTIYNRIVIALVIEFGPYHPDIFPSYLDLAASLCDVKQFDQALEIYENVYQVLKNMFKANHPDVLNTLDNLANTLACLNRNDEAIKILNDILYELKLKDSTGLPVLKVKFKIAVILNKEFKDLNKSLSLLKECYEIGKYKLGIDHPWVSKIIKNIKEINFVSLYPGCDIEIIWKNVWENMLKAVIEGDETILKELIRRGGCVNHRDSEGRTLLHFAVNIGKLNIINLLLQNGVEVTLSSNKGNTSLHTAAAKNNHNILEILLSHLNKVPSNFINAKTKAGGNTALHIAAKNGCRNSVKCLLKYNAGRCEMNNNGLTPEQVATTDAVKLLLISSQN